jgi:hypothetical protein
VQDVIALMDYLKINKAYILGISMWVAILHKELHLKPLNELKN